MELINILRQHFVCLIVNSTSLTMDQNDTTMNTTELEIFCFGKKIIIVIMYMLYESNNTLRELATYVATYIHK